MKKQKIEDSENSRKYAFNKSLRYLSIRARSVKEVYEYLNRKNFAEESINSVLKKLLDLRFLDDREFARQWIESRQKNRGKAKFVIKRELKEKGINDDLAEPLLTNSQEDIETAKNLFNKRKDRIRAKNKIDFRNKMGAFLSRRGFSWEVIRKVINEAD